MADVNKVVGSDGEDRRQVEYVAKCHPLPSGEVDLADEPRKVAPTYPCSSRTEARPLTIIGRLHKGLATETLDP